MKLRAFIGSSSKNLNISNAIKHNLHNEVECIVWKDGFFRLSRTTLETLVTRVDEFDLGIFVFGQDDTVSIGGIAGPATRDNVIYEFGLFCGRLGPHRSFVVRATDKSLRWLSDLDGFTAAQFDSELAATNADRAIEDACRQIRNTLDRFVPKPGVYANRTRIRLGSDWWTYGGAEPSSMAADEEGLQLTTPESIGLMYPHFDNLDARGRFCAIRLMAIPSSPSRYVYVSIRTDSGKVLLALSDSHTDEGWGEPRNEFMIRLPHFGDSGYKAVLLDLERLKPYVGSIRSVNGFRIRPGVKVSHFCVFDERPIWLTEAESLFPIDAPLAISEPSDDGIVNREHVVEGTVSLGNPMTKHDDLQAFVLSPDSFWYPQGPLTIANGRWRVKAYFGDENDGAGCEFSVAVITTGGRPAKERLAELPPALARSIIRVTRRT